MKKQRPGPTADRFVQETVALIDERGGSSGVNLREVSRRVGCAHTNAYNYFASFDELIWAAFREALGLYGDFLVRDLDDAQPPREYIRRLVSNLAAYPEEEPGLYRFIGSDPIDMESIPTDVLEKVGEMKQWLSDTIRSCYPGAAADAEEASNIVLAYIDGETLNLINGRVIPGEDVRGRIVDNSMRLLSLLAGDSGADGSPVAKTTAYPRLEVRSTRRRA
jgi:AcrR family transcriptional regulator